MCVRRDSTELILDDVRQIITNYDNNKDFGMFSDRKGGLGMQIQNKICAQKKEEYLC